MAVEKNALKAAYIEKLTRFIEWPDQVDMEKNTIFSLCLIGEDTLDGALHNLAMLTKVKDKRLLVKQQQSIEDINGCNALFISSTVSDQLVDVLDHIHGRPILTLADTAGYASMGVMINFYSDVDRVHFEINHDAAKLAGIKVGSRVLKLARIVKSDR